MINFEDYVTEIQLWLDKTSQANTGLSGSREWCTLGIEDLTQVGLRKEFDRSEVNQAYADEVTGRSVKGTPYAFLQTDADLLYSLHKSMVARHKGRMMHYRDDTSQKGFRTYSTISLGLAKYAKLKELAENKG